jgi:molybdate transport system substrate-binding protein
MNRVVAVFLGWALMAMAGCSRQTGGGDKPGPLRVLCGSSMAKPGQEMCRLFKDRHGVQVLVDLGGSETLLPRVLAGAQADVFVCHDPFEQRIKEAGRWAGSARVGQLKPVLLVRPGNPCRLKSIRDLTNRDLKIGIGDPRYSTCGALFVELLEKEGLREGVMRQVTLQGRTHAEIADGLILGPLDAVVVWNYIASLYRGKVELVPTTDRYPETYVTVVGLRQSPNPELRDAFLKLCRSDAVQAIFARHGYGSPAP